MQKKLRSKKELEKYFGRTFFEIKTQLKDFKITQHIKEVYVEDLNDFKLMRKPGPESDMLIGDYSCHSEYIYDFQEEGLYMDLGFFTLERYETKNLSTYCEKEQLETVIDLHMASMRKAVTDLKDYLSNKILDLETIDLLMRIVKIQFEGIDNWNRPIFREVSSKNRFGDVNNLFSYNHPNENGKLKNYLKKCKQNPNIYLEWFGTGFGCEPHGGLCYDIKLQIVD